MQIIKEKIIYNEGKKVYECFYRTCDHTWILRGVGLTVSSASQTAGYLSAENDYRNYILNDDYDYENEVFENKDEDLYKSDFRIFDKKR